MAGLSLNAANQAVDAIFVGRLGVEALAALVLLAPLAGLVAAAGIGLGAGTANGIARALGRGAAEDARQIAGIGLIAAAFIACLAATGLILARDPVLQLLSAAPGVAQQARPYMLPLGLSLAASILQILCDFIAIGRGNARFSLQTLALCFGLNMVLNPLFIFGLGLGLPGSAWATLAAQLVTLAVWFRHFQRAASRPRPGPLALLRPILAIGLPEAGAIAASTLGVILLMRLAAEYGDTGSLAGFGLALRMLFMVMLPLEGFAIGILPVLAHAHGAADPGRARRILGQVLCFALLATGALSLLLVLAPGFCAGLFSQDPALIRAASQDLRYLAFAPPAIALRLLTQIGLQAAFRPRAAALLGLAPLGWMLWPVTGLVLLLAGPDALALAVSLSCMAAAILACAFLRQILFTPHSPAVIA